MSDLQQAVEKCDNFQPLHDVVHLRCFRYPETTHVLVIYPIKSCILCEQSVAASSTGFVPVILNRFKAIALGYKQTHHEPICYAQVKRFIGVCHDSEIRIYTFANISFRTLVRVQLVLHSRSLSWFAIPQTSTI